jgi:predicted AlkP superfamily phosphohydrolase/phosphomutase
VIFTIVVYDNRSHSFEELTMLNSNQPSLSKPIKPVVIIGLDGATFDLIEPWSQAGHLPNLARLMSEGAWGRLQSTEPPHSAPAWATFSTGLNPGRHGVYFFVAPSRDKSRFRPVSAESIRGRRLWQLVSDQGGRVGIVNVPMSYPPVPVNGYMVGDFFAPDYRSAFNQPELYEEVIRECGGYCAEVWPQPNRQRYLQEMLACIDQQGRVGAYLLERHPTDFFAYVFTVLDRAQHKFWADMDTEHPIHRQRRKQMIPDALLQVHKHLDVAIGRLLEKVNSDTTVVIVSDHGFRGEYRRLAVNRWLQELGLLNTRARGAGIMNRLRVSIKQSGLQKPVQRLLRLMIGTSRHESLSYQFVNWPETKISYGPGQGFYVNLKGRDHDGVVTQSEYEPLRDRVIKALKEVRDPQTGLPVVSDVFRREEIYEGSGFEWAPDIIPARAEYVTNGKRWGYGLSKSLGAPYLFMDQDDNTGNHAYEGIFIARGPHVRGGCLTNLNIMDVAPTTLFALGLSVPKGMDGKVHTELFAPAYVEENPVAFSDIDLDLEGKAGQVLSAAHEALVEKRLKDLGYL